MILVQHFLAQQRMRLAMAQISGRRADQLGDFVAVLELGAIDLDDARADRLPGSPPWLPPAGSCPNPSAPETGRLPIGRPGLRHPGQMSLVDVDDLLDRLVLADNPLPQIRVELFRVESRSVLDLAVY